MLLALFYHDYNYFYDLLFCFVEYQTFFALELVITA